MSYLSLFKGYQIFVVLFLFILSMTSIASLTWSDEKHGKEGHAEQAPHGGQILDTGEKHVEFLVKGGKEVYVYLYDQDLKPMSAEGTEGTVYFKLVDNSRKESKLTSIKENDTSYLKGDVDLGTGDYTEAVVSLKTADKRENLRFGQPVRQEHHK